MTSDTLRQDKGNFLPPKVIFLHLSVILFMGSMCDEAGHAWQRGGVHGEGMHAWQEEGHVWQGGMHTG